MPQKIQDHSIFRRIVATLQLQIAPQQMRLEDDVKMVFDLSNQQRVLSTVKAAKTFFNASTTGVKTIYTVPAGKRAYFYGGSVYVEILTGPGTGKTNQLNAYIDGQGIKILGWTASQTKDIGPSELIQSPPFDEGDYFGVNVSEIGNDSLNSYMTYWIKEEWL